MCIGKREDRCREPELSSRSRVRRKSLYLLYPASPGIFLSLVDVSVWVRHLVDANPVGHRGRAGNSRVLPVFREK